MMGLVKVRHGRYSSAVVVPQARGASRSHDPGRNGAYTRYTSMLAVLVVLLALPLADANAQVDDCDSCDVGTYAPVKGSESCLECGRGTYQASSGSSKCTDCGAGIFLVGMAYMGWCCVRQTRFQVQGNHLATGTMYSGAGNTTWFHTAVESIGLRAMLDSMRMDWVAGNSIAAKWHQRARAPVVAIQCQSDAHQKLHLILHVL